MATPKITFQERCDMACQQARKAVYPQLPTQKDYEVSLESLVIDLCSMPREDAVMYIRATYEYAGLMPLAMLLYNNHTL